MHNSRLGWRIRAAKVAIAVSFSTALLVSLPATAQGNPPPPNPDAQAAGHPPSLEPTPLPNSPRPQPTGTLTLGQRAKLEAHTTFGLAAYIIPAGNALIDMSDPPHSYPHEWRDGGQAFGRLYGAEFARHTAGGVTHFAVAAIDREDPRYYFSTSHSFVPRVFYALIFTVVDRSDSGHRTLAVSNIAGSAAAGAVGMAFYPDGYRDLTHAYQRAAVETTTFATHNLIAEFSPEIGHVLRVFGLSKKGTGVLLPPDTPKP